MKKIIFLFILALSVGFVGQSQVVVRKNYAAYLGALDTLTNADATSYTTTVNGPKSEISYQIKVLKISGTVAGHIKLHGSIDGADFGSAALDSVTLADASAVYQIRRTSNTQQKLRLTVTTTGTSSASQRTYLLYRE